MIRRNSRAYEKGGCAGQNTPEVPDTKRQKCGRHFCLQPKDMHLQVKNMYLQAGDMYL